MKKIPTLTSNRLILRPFALTDAKDVQRLVGDRAIAETTLNIPHPYENGMAEEWISIHAKNFDEDKLLNLAITIKDTNELIGAIGLVVKMEFDRAEVGYWIGKPFWGKGYCTEAAFTLLHYGFSVMQLNRIYSTHFIENPASGRVMEKLGMKKEGILRQHIKKWGVFHDIVEYGILKNEFQFAIK